VFAYLDERVNGATVQRSMNVHALTNDPRGLAKISDQIETNKMKTLDSKLLELRQREKSLLNGGASQSDQKKPIEEAEIVEVEKE
jgi:hypothetical protein